MASTQAQQGPTLLPGQRVRTLAAFLLPTITLCPRMVIPESWDTRGTLLAWGLGSIGIGENLTLRFVIESSGSSVTLSLVGVDKLNAPW